MDLSSALGVGVRTGKPAASTPALEIGSGEFPHKLSAQFLYRGVPRETETFGMNPRVGDRTVKGWTNNWDFQFSLSASAMEAIGKSSPLAATRAIAALKAALDIQAGTSNLPRRDVAAMLTLGWWLSVEPKQSGQPWRLGLHPADLSGRSVHGVRLRCPEPGDAGAAERGDVGGRGTGDLQLRSAVAAHEPGPRQCHQHGLRL